MGFPASMARAAGDSPGRDLPRDRWKTVSDSAMSEPRPSSDEPDRRRHHDASAARLRAVADAVQDAIVCADADGVVTLWLGGAEALLGWSAKEALGHPIAGFFPDRLRPAYMMGFREALAGGRADLLHGRVIDIVGLRRDGSEFPANSRAERGRRRAVPGQRDPRHRRPPAGRGRPRACAHPLSQRLEHAATGMTMSTPDGRFIAVNPAFCRLVGRSADSRSALAFSDITHPADQEADLVNVARLASGEADHVHIAKRYLRPDGAVVWVEAQVSPRPRRRGRVAALPHAGRRRHRAPPHRGGI